MTFLKVAATIIISVAVICAGLCEPKNAAMAVGGLAVFAIVVFWRQIKELIEKHDIVIGRERIEITHPPQAISTELVGGVRDNFIFLGNHFFIRQQWDTSYEHYLAANRLKESILTAFRCMACLARIDIGSSDELRSRIDNLLRDFYDQALWHADGPHAELKGRECIAEWVRGLRARCNEDDFPNTLRRELARLIF